MHTCYFLLLGTELTVIALFLKSFGFLFCHFMMIVASLYKSHSYVENMEI